MILPSSYKPPFGFANGHIQSIYPSVFRKTPHLVYNRERINTPDNDFLDLDWIHKETKKCVVLCHGLEGDSQKVYMKGMASILSGNNFSSCSWNFRGCSGEINRNLQMYHGGATHDLDLVIQHVAQQYEDIYLLGFSMGANLSLKYLGESIPKTKIKACVAFSAPIDLGECARVLEKKINVVYNKLFIKQLGDKIKKKEKQFPQQISFENYKEVKTLEEFDNRYTADLFGYKDANEYYLKNSSKQFISSIQTPTLIVNAKNDPFLVDSCYPIKECEKHSFVDLEMPNSGGHIGFISKEKYYWSERRALEFFLSS